MATALTVPRHYQSAFAKIRDLDRESAHELIAALQKVPSTINVDSLSSAVAAMVDTIAVSDVEEIVPATLSLHSLKESLQLSVPEVAEGLALGMEELPFERLRSSPEQRDALRDRLAELLNTGSLGVIARAGRLSLENERSLTETRIVTDIRPIFERETPQARPTGAVIIHTLKISYRADNDSKEFFVTLDANDVRELSEQLERADLKAGSLKAVLDAAQVPYIDAE